MAAVNPSTHDHGFVLITIATTTSFYFCLFVFFCVDIPSWHCAHGPKTLRMMMMMMMVKPQERKEWKMVRDEEKFSLSISGHLIYSGSFSLFVFFNFGHFLYIYRYMHFVFLCCDFNIFCFFFFFFILNYPHRNEKFKTYRPCFFGTTHLAEIFETVQNVFKKISKVCLILLDWE